MLETDGQTDRTVVDPRQTPRRNPNQDPQQESRMARMLLLFAFWLPWLACTYLAFAPSPPDAIFRVSDVLLHGIAFSYLTFASGLAHHARRWLPTVGWMIAYGVAIEFVQSFEPERSAELKDVLVDVVGIGIGIVALRLIGLEVDNRVHWLADAVARWLPARMDENPPD